MKAAAVDVVMALMGELEVPEDAEGREVYMLDMAEALREGAGEVIERLEKAVRESRLGRGVCPECAVPLEEVKAYRVERHPYGMGTAAEEWKEVTRYECPLCGSPFAAEEVGEPVW